MRANPAGEPTINFSDPQAVLCLNRALLAAYYDVEQWGIPDGYLCPPIPGRADYIHTLADLLKAIDPHNTAVRVLDIGTGANCIYPILGAQTYGWKFVGSEVDTRATKSARRIVRANASLQKRIRIVQQANPKQIFTGIIKPSDRFAATMCNPPFHASAAEAEAGSQRKQKNLRRSKPGPSTGPGVLNFGGQANELWCEGGELQFVRQMIEESVTFQAQVGWFTTLISKRETLKKLAASLNRAGVTEWQELPLAHGQKVSRVLAWRFQ